MIDVRIEKNGAYFRLTWVTPAGARRSEGLGHASTMTDREREKRRREKGVELEADPEMADAGSMRLSHWGARFLAGAQADLSEASAKDLATTFDYLTEFFALDPMLRSITTSQAKDFRQWLEARPSRGGTLALATIRKHIRNCQTMFAQAVREKNLTGVRDNPFQHEESAVPPARKDHAQIGDEELARIMAACPDDEWRAMFALCRWAGLRQNEARRLRWADVRWDHPPRLLVRLPDHLDEPDNKHRERTVPIQPRLLALLRDSFGRAVEGSQGPCEGLPFSGPAISIRASRIARKAGLAYAKPLHTLRKNLQNEWEQAIGDRARVCAMLGNSPRVAEKNYTRIDDRDLEKITGCG